ncbi:MAG: beta-propeller domain-containing protein, partial [Nitriliruptorales bacterium]
VGPWGLGGSGMGGGIEFVADTAPAAGEADGAGQRSAAVPGVDYSATNVQVSGVDEPDLVKTDGRTLYTVTTAGVLRVVSVADGTPRALAEVRLSQHGGDHRLLLDGDRLLVVSSEWDPALSPRPLPEPEPTADAPADGDAARSKIWRGPGSQGTTILRLFDVADPASPRPVGELRVEGQHLSSRLVDGVVRVALRTEPVLGFTSPNGPEAEVTATKANREVVASSELDDWLPRFEHRDRRDGDVASGNLFGRSGDCSRVNAPSTFSGFGSLVVLTLGMDDNGMPRDRVAVLAGGNTLYASADLLYVATNRWFDPAAIEPAEESTDYSTEIHVFDISDPDRATYLASGSVPGHLLNQFSMDHYDGHLRVATTEGAPWAAGSVSTVTVLERRGDGLVAVGEASGLGEGERIFAVRFMGPRGYVVTFRQFDPLYTLDLSSPTSPRAAGELKIPGYSAYLHPIADDLLLGLGQDATEEGRITGTQLALFDVSDPAAPARVAGAKLDDTTSDAEWDHHAFLWWEPTGLVVVPVQRWSFGETDGRERWFSGAAAFRVDTAGSVEEAGLLSHLEVDEDGWARLGEDAWRADIRRALVVGDTLYTVSDAGIEAADLVTLAEESFLRF